MTELRAFERFIAPMSASDFFASVFGRTPLHLSDRPASVLDDVLTLADISTYLASNPQPDLVQVLAEDARAPQKDWTRFDACADAAPLVDAKTLMSLIDCGMSVRLSSVHRSIPRLKAFCSTLEQDLGMPMRANVYITPPGRKALAPHYDRYDVFVLQLLGQKRWALFDHQMPSATLETRKMSETSLPGPEQASMVLSPGCLAYVPRGLVHSAETVQGVSIHVTLGLLHPTLGNVIEAVAAQSWHHTELRHAVPHGYSSDAERERSLEAVLAAMQRFATREVIEKSLDNVQAIAQAKMIDPMHMSLERNLLAKGLTNDTEFVLQSEDPILCSDQDGITMSVQCQHHSFLAPVFARQAIDRINTGERFSAQQLPGMITPDYKLELVKELFKAGFLTQVDAQVG